MTNGVTLEDTDRAARCDVVLQELKYQAQTLFELSENTPYPRRRLLCALEELVRDGLVGVREDGRYIASTKGHVFRLTREERFTVG